MPGEFPRGVQAAHRHSPDRRLWLDRDQFRHRRRLAEQRPGHGHVATGFEARVIGRTTATSATATPGELILRADEPFAFATNYFAHARADRGGLADGWFHTGDRVVRDADGYFRFVDRLKDAIRRRGENISSFEVEQVLLSHPDVANVAVFPVRSELAEDEVMAAIVRRPDSALETSR